MKNGLYFVTGYAGEQWAKDAAKSLKKNGTKVQIVKNPTQKAMKAAAQGEAIVFAVNVRKTLHDKAMGLCQVNAHVRHLMKTRFVDTTYKNHVGKPGIVQFDR